MTQFFIKISFLILLWIMRKFNADKINIILIMKQQNIHLDQLPRIYKKLQADPKMFSLTALDFICELNKEVGFEDEMIKQGYQMFPYKHQFQKKKSLSQFQQFFGYIALIESTYLQESTDKIIIKEAKVNNQEQYSYLLNKDSISKFIRDEALHYQTVLDKYLVNIKQGQLQKGVKSVKLHSLFIELFKSEFIRIVINNQNYLNRPVSQIQIDLGNTLIEYSKQIKSKQDEELKEQFIIPQEQILDFLTFWLKQKSKDNILVVYDRTKQRLDQLQQKLITKPQIIQKLPLQEMKIQNISKIQQKVEKAIQQMELPKIQQIVKQTSTQKVVKEVALHKQPKYKPIQPYIRNTEPNQQFCEVKSVPKAQIKTIRKKEDVLNAQMKKLFKFGCQRRYKFDKNSTFQQISQSTKTMDLQKFLYFCNFFQILSMIHRQKLIQLFKTQCVNRLIDLKKFQGIIQKMIVINSTIIDNLLNKRNFEVNKKKIMIHKDNKTERLSQYKFELRPVNGMDISTIQKQLTHRKLFKLALKEEKGKMVYDKRETEKPIKEVKKSRSQFGNKLSALDLQPIRDGSFNPEKLFMSDPDHDKLWEDYQAKIWKTQKNSSNVLQSILSKRIARGTRIIDKINSQISFAYD